MNKIYLFFIVLMLGGCAATIPRSEVDTKRFPSVEGTSLNGGSVRLPDDFAGKPVLLLVCYAMRTQFDADRWMLGLLQLQTPIQVYEVPTIDGMVPSVLSERIDAGMRKGIPSEDWGSVITVYGDSGKLLSFTGNENPNNARVILVDGNGIVKWFHDRGFSANKMIELDQSIRTLIKN